MATIFLKEKNEETAGFDLRLRQKVSSSVPIGQLEFKIPAGTVNSNSSRRYTRTERVVKQELRACTVYLKPPQRKGKKLESIAINVVHCKEVETPLREEPIEWYLLTSFPIKDEQAAMEIVNWYLCRWVIEICQPYYLHKNEMYINLPYVPLNYKSIVLDDFLNLQVA